MSGRCSAGVPTRSCALRGSAGRGSKPRTKPSQALEAVGKSRVPAAQRQVLAWRRFLVAPMVVLCQMATAMLGVAGRCGQ